MLKNPLERVDAPTIHLRMVGEDHYGIHNRLDYSKVLGAEPLGLGAIEVRVPPPAAVPPQPSQTEMMERACHVGNTAPTSKKVINFNLAKINKIN